MSFITLALRLFVLKQELDGQAQNIKMKVLIASHIPNLILEEEQLSIQLPVTIVPNDSIRQG